MYLTLFNPNATLPRPYNLFCGILLILCACCLLWHRKRRKLDGFTYGLLYGMIPFIFGEFYAAFGSSKQHDSFFNMSRFMMIIGLICPLTASILDTVKILIKKPLWNKH
eukprot:TRINITY_DN13071_c0_g1_i1.p1 TRINITY_DN13071_c0_g1~~TRINITY_DN13071_c0_g1_i1.p1  ORF type:complete len:109 (+),score=15.86 TRINITY_DN13071_c0_g1_i1:104-430(+)